MQMDNSITQSLSMFAGNVANEIIIAPKTCGDPYNTGEWLAVSKKVLSYLERNIIGQPWVNELVLVSAVMSARRYEVSTICRTLSTINPKLKSIFEIIGIEKMADWKPEQYIPDYLKGDILPSESQSTRQYFLKRYQHTCKIMSKWLESLPIQQKEIYIQFILPAIDEKYLVGLKRMPEVEEQQRRTRKAETDAVLPHFANIRAEAHYRFNRIIRLRKAYLEALKTVNENNYTFPFSFSYQEWGNLNHSLSAKERLTFRIWDRQSFLHSHADSYSRSTVSKIKRVPNFTFLEYVSSERLVGDAPAEGLWFEDLLRRDVLGNNAVHGPKEEVEAKLTWLKSWGYTDKPFMSDVGGLLAWPIAESCFIHNAQERTDGLLIPVDAVYGAVMIGLMAIDLFTTTGARINEVMQIRLADDCIVRLKMPAPPGAKDQSLRIRYTLRLVPKGEKRNIPQDYFIGEETKHLLVKTAKMLSEHYNLQEGEHLPMVDFNKNNGRSTRFNKGPYLFQYNSKHLSVQAIGSCMRFLLHGMIFKTRDGKMVVVKPHLLRHAFATHAVQVEKIPIDIVGAWLHQKDLDVTDYYSKPTESMIAEAADQFLSRASTNINVNEIMLRTPEELQTLYEDARGKAGTLAEVIGGQCVSHGYCAAKFACVGCAGKVPDPTKRYQIEKHKIWAKEQVDYATQEGLNPEAERMKQLIRDCEDELTEMNLIEAYREDEKREVKIRIEE